MCKNMRKRSNILLHGVVHAVSINNSVESSDHQDHVLGRGSPLVFKVEENNLSMNMLVTVTMLQM